ncbi:LAFE_0G05006g1_1 [Lachancea fermentati]|uniref:LAFE_0G05006g1_1 n=1 Tax=Lachancea fermentati TaxID=4955 RepID=A0A1G4MH78_LACFM|nr:LAFE_0G05006g1_1 [Lachancea fermentati]
MASPYVERVLLSLLAIFIPPVAVGLRVGFRTKDTLINVLFTIILFVFGVAHALYVIFTTSNISASSHSDYTSLDNKDDLEAQIATVPSADSRGHNVTSNDEQSFFRDQVQEQPQDYSEGHSQDYSEAHSQEQPPNYNDVARPGVLTAAQAATDFKIQH